MSDLDSPQAPIESTTELGDDPAALAKRWITEVQLYERKRERFNERGKKIVRRYKDERDSQHSTQRRMNVFWANTETLKPTVYAQTPKPEVKRRYRDQDPVGRVASQILERACEYALDCDDRFDETMRQVRDDYLLVGLGVAWQRYVPHYRQQPVFQIDSEFEGQGYADEAGGFHAEAIEGDDGFYVETLDYEEVVDDYVHWTDFGHNAGARVWGEVYAVWRKAYMTREELHERFDATAGVEAVNRIPLDRKPDDLQRDQPVEQFKKATIYEIWDKASGQAIWIHREYPQGPLDVRPDPLGLKGFFPCPRPLFATLANDNLIPAPDYALYQDQIDEIDELTVRIDKLTRALRLRGIYASSQKEAMQRLMDEADEGDLIPVDAEAFMGTPGGLESAIVWMPVREVAEALIRAYEGREQAKAALYEVSGISDILRGSTEASETATAQALKAQWGSVRVREKQQEIQRFARDMIRIKAEIISEHFSPETILQMASAEMLPPQDQQLVPQALQLLKQDRLRGFRVEIETDSTIAADEEADKASRVEFLGAVTQFVQGWAEPLAAAPQLAPMAAEMLKFAVRGFKAGETLESVIEQTMDAISQQAMQPPEPPPPDPAQEAKTQADMAKAQATVAKSQADTQKAGIELMKAEVEAATLPQRLAAEQENAALRASQMTEGGI